MMRKTWRGQRRSLCRSRYHYASAMTLLALVSGGCSLDSLLNRDELPPNLSDPAITQTAAGARNAYYGTLVTFRDAFAGRDNSFVESSGTLGDELTYGSFSGNGQGVDTRNVPTGSNTIDPTYAALQKLRGQANQALGLLRDYLPTDSALAGHLYALQGYVEVFLAELYCSGIPLSTLDYQGDFTYQTGIPTEHVLERAVAHFDTALALTGDSVRFADLAHVGRARALLDLGAFSDASAAVATVSDLFQYAVQYNTDTLGTLSAQNFAYVLQQSGVFFWGSLNEAVPNQEGTNGMDWASSGDPRTTIVTLQGNVELLHYPAKYDILGGSPVVLASGIEARLIEAEAALQTHDTVTWLAKLNQLRQTAWPTIVPAVGAALSPLADPGSDTARVSLLFRERAFWLFLTGHRQGDLRRLTHSPYNRPQSAVYPVGPVLGSGYHYGPDVDLPVPASEFVNPLYTGCMSRG